MKLEPAQIARFEEFLTTISGQTYPEPPSPQHDQISEQVMDLFWAKCAPPPSARVLDVGCGQGVALKRFAARSCDVTGVALDQTDVDVCQPLGYTVLEMDQSFLDFPARESDRAFGLQNRRRPGHHVQCARWSRHVLVVHAATRLKQRQTDGSGRGAEAPGQ
jgi:SAM-dependent methyltransferase